MTTNRNQIEQDASGEKDASPPPTSEKEALSIAVEIIGTYKKLIASDEADLQKLSREMTKPFVTASAIVTRLNRAKKV